MITKTFTKEGLEKAKQILANIPPAHRSLLIQSLRSTRSTPRPVERPDDN